MRHHISRIDTHLRRASDELQLPVVHFEPTQIKLKSILPLYPFHLEWKWEDIRDAIIPFGIVTIGRKLHFNLIVVRDGQCTRYEPHRHATLCYREERVDTFLKSRFSTYVTRYDTKCGTMCIEDSFVLLLRSDAT